MFVVTSYPLAVVLCIITMLCWGSWANTQKLASKEWRFQLFYWDYSIGVLLLAVALAFTLGNSGEAGRPFLADLAQADMKWLKSAFVSGVIFNLSNILLVAAIDIAGLAVAFPVGVGLALVLGVVFTTRPVTTTVKDMLNWFDGQPVDQQSLLLQFWKQKANGSGYESVVLPWPAYLQIEKQVLAAWHTEKSTHRVSS